MIGWCRRRIRSPWTWVVVVTVAVTATQAFAWYQLHEAEEAFAADRVEDSRRHLASCSVVWPWGNRTDVRILSARLARRTGDLSKAMATLRDAHRSVGETTPELAFEWALVQAADGNVAEVADYLQREAEAGPERQKAVWEALVQGYLAVYRANDAYTICEEWVKAYPDDLRGRELRGLAAIQGRGRGLQLGADDLKYVLDRDPDRPNTRAARAVALLELGAFDEAIPELQRLVQDEPDDPNHRVRLARSLNMTGRGGEAVELLDAVLRDHPGFGPALRTRGQFALGTSKWSEAERWLADAAEALPNDYQTHYLYSQALQQNGKSAAAETQLARANEIRDRLTQISELRTRKLAERPLDPSLYTEMGRLLIANGSAALGVQWLEAAVALEPGFRPAHEALADYYEAAGDPAKADSHRRVLAAGR